MSVTVTKRSLPINRIVAFVGPYVAVLAGVVADWLFVHLHFLGTFHITHNQVANAIAQVIVFGLTAVLVWAGQQKWLEGWQRWESVDTVTTPPVAPPQ